MASLSTSASFHQTFQALKSDILATLDRPNAPISDITRQLADLKAQLSIVLSSLPAYDQRSYELQVRELDTKLANVRARSRPKSKFAFGKSAAASTDSTVATPSSSENFIPDADPPAEGSTWGSGSAAGASSIHRRISNRKGDRVVLFELEVAEGHDKSWTLSLEDLEDCTIDLRRDSGSSTLTQSGLSSLHARNLKACRIWGGTIDGSAMLHDLEDCTFVATVHQFRIHTSHRCEISLYIPSVPIIEACSDLVFRPHSPDTEENDAAAPPANRVSEVADFSWIKPTPSPNWTYVDTPASG